MKYPIAVVILLSLIPGVAIGLMLNPLVRVEGHLQGAVWLEVTHRICTGIGGLGTFITLIIVVRQFHLLRTQSEMVQKNIVASMDAQLYSRLDSFNRFVFEHYLEYDLLDKPYRQDEPPEQRSKLHRMCELGYTFFEEILTHHLRLKLLETEDWEKWEQNMIHFFQKPYVRGYWNHVAGRYGRSFRTFANDLVMKLGSEPGTGSTTPHS